MFTDMVGYTALSQRNEALALELLEEHRRILRSIFPRFNGTEIKTIGDAFLVEFQSALEAAQCALEIQRTLAKRNPDVSSDRHIELRIGIHVGDVVHREGDVYGDGVNIASRIQPVAGIGGICISVDVERQIHHALDARFEKLAPIELKNVEVPMDLFRIVLPWERQTASAAKSEIRNPKSETLSRRIFATSIAIVLLLAGLLGYQLWRTRNQPAPRQNAGPAGTEAATGSTIAQKSIAVLPFENLSRDPDNAFFTDGVQDQILTDLSQIADLKVISRTSVMQYKSGAARNLRKIGEELGVAHVVEGSVQRAANKVRVNAQLIDARNDAHLWAQTYDRDLADVFAIQSEIAKAIADQLQAKLSPNEKASIEKPPTTDVTAFDLYSRARNLILTTAFSATGGPTYLRAIDLLNQAMTRDPSFLLAQCQLVYANANLYFLGIDHTEARRALADAAVEAAFRIRRDAGEAHLARAENLYRVHRDYDGALAELEIARRTLPNDPQIFELTGYIARRRGQQEEGLRNLQRAVELDPRNYFTLQQVAFSFLNLRRYSEAIGALDRALSIKPDNNEAKATRALLILDQSADTRPLHRAIEEIRVKGDREAIESVADLWFLCALAERDAAAAHAALAALGENSFGNDAVLLFRPFGEGLIARMEKDDAKARTSFATARADHEKRLETQPDYAPAICVLGLIDAGLGNKGAALREGRRAMELLPYSADSVNGARMIEYFAIIAAWVGEKDLALEYLNKAEQLIGFGTITYGQLKLLPYWDPLRGDPRFEKIVESLAPKG